MGTHPIFESDFDCLTVQKHELIEQKSGIMGRTQQMENIRRIRDEIEQQKAKISEYEKEGITLEQRAKYMKLIGSNNQARDDCYKVIGVLANINGCSVRSLHQTYDVE